MYQIKEKDDIELKKIRETYFGLLNKTIQELGFTQNEAPAFLGLIEKVKHYDFDYVKKYFNKILSINYCKKCSSIFEDENTPPKCNVDNCGGELVSFSSLIKSPEFINKIFELFWIFHYYPTMLLESYNKLFDEYTVIMAKITEKKKKIENKKSTDTSGFFSVQKTTLSEDEKEQLENLEARKKNLRESQERINLLLNEINSSSFIDLLKRSSFSNLAFNMRNINDQVAIEEAELQKVSIGEKRFKLRYKKSNPKDIGNVLSRFYPYGIIKYNFSKNIVVRIDIDKIKTDEILKSYKNTLIKYRRYCPKCSGFVQLNETEHRCTCGSQTIEAIPIYPSKIYIHKDDVKLAQNIEGRTIYSKTTRVFPFSSKDDAPDKTYTVVIHHLEKKDFIPKTKLSIKEKGKDDLLCELFFGSLKIFSYADFFKTIYESKLYDRTERPFKLCATCLSIWDQGRDDQGNIKNYCSSYPGEHKDPMFVRLIHLIETEGIKIDFSNSCLVNPSNLSHTLAHGLRVALQNISGVDVREIAEVFDEDMVYYLYDNVPGGNAICESIFKKKNEEYHSLKEAQEIILTILSDECKNGCPICLYQFNCIERNNPKTFSKELLINCLNRMDLENIESEDIE